MRFPITIVLGFLLLLVLGIVEFGYLLGEFNDVRHGAREGARLAAVNSGDNNFLETVTVDRMDLTAVVTVEFTDGVVKCLGRVCTGLGLRLLVSRGSCIY